MKNFTVPDICDSQEDIQIGNIFLNSYGGKDKFCGEIQTAECEHSNSVVKELVEEDGSGKVLVINHTGSELCSMVGDQIAQKAYDNNWNGIITNGYIRDIEVIKDIPIGVYARNSYPMKTNKSIGKGQVNIPIKVNNISINPGNWIYIDSNGWIISKSELEL
tara:strand:+ start:351 stop:836 length:486 start_codon:yes stop_codon:yes gene_type:complete